MGSSSWDYKGYKLNIDIDIHWDNDCMKGYHWYIAPGETHGKDAAITPYDWTKETFELFIDAGCPERQRFNWDKEMLLDKLKSLW